MSGLFSNILKLAGRSLQSAFSFRQFHALPSTTTINKVTAPVITSPWSTISVRTKIRNNFPKPSEYKRVKTHGWRVKLKTRSGRRMIMRRILKGRFYLTH